MASQLKERIKTDLDKAKQEGQLRSSRIRDIVRLAIAQSLTEIKAGSQEMRQLVRDAIAGVVDSLREGTDDLKEEVTATIEGALDAVSEKRRDEIAATETEMLQLQDKIHSEELALQTEVDTVLEGLDEDGKVTPTRVQKAIHEAVAKVKDTEEFSVMQKRYAQLQAQLAILRANLASRYGERYENVEQYLKDAQAWYERAKTRTEADPDWLEHRQTAFEQKLGEAGSVVAQREERVKHILKELWHAVQELFRSDSKK